MRLFYRWLQRAGKAAPRGQPFRLPQEWPDNVSLAWLRGRIASQRPGPTQVRREGLPRDEINVPSHAIMLDRRVLGFRERGFCQALTSVWQDQGRDQVAMAASFDAAERSAAVRVSVGHTQTELRLSEHDIIAALIAWCVGARVPLPAGANKALTIADGGVMLDFTVAYTSMPSHRGQRPAGKRVAGEWR